MIKFTVDLLYYIVFHCKCVSMFLATVYHTWEELYFLALLVDEDQPL